MVTVRSIDIDIYSANCNDDNQVYLSFIHYVLRNTGRSYVKVNINMTESARKYHSSLLQLVDFDKYCTDKVLAYKDSIPKMRINGIPVCPRRFNILYNRHNKLIKSYNRIITERDAIPEYHILIDMLVDSHEDTMQYSNIL